MRGKIDRAEARRYDAPGRAEGAVRTRLKITKAAKDCFERYGWSGATVALIAKRAGVAQSTVEAVFRTKRALLEAAVDYGIRGDVDPLPISGREVTRHIDEALDPTSMLELHAAHVRGVQARAAKLVFVVEQGAKSDKGVAALWRQMQGNLRYGVEWATRTLLAKPGAEHLDASDVKKTFWLALDWGTYRTLTEYAGLTDDDYEQWLLQYYRRMFGFD
jgi:AcrR family transcriptional regulator